MVKTELTIHMLGDFSVQCGESRIGNRENRSHKIWLLLAYLIYCRKQRVTTEDLTGLLWSETETNSANALKTTLHRVRSCLNQLYPGAGHQLIVYRAGYYSWNTEIPLSMDVEEFDALCRAGAAAESEEERMLLRMRALQQYRGDFLKKLSSNSWVMPILAYYHGLFVETVLQTLPLLEAHGRWEEVCALCRRALQLEPCHETIYRSLMRALFALGQPQEVTEIYETMSEQLMAVFGMLPGDETRALYHKLLQTNHSYALAGETLLEELCESDGAHGAMLCDFDFFRSIYRANARLLERGGNTAHIALITVNAQSHRELSHRSLDRTMKHLTEVICNGLRCGDIVTRCSASQLAVLLPGASYENSVMICNRVFRTFYRRYPQSPARLHAFVHRMEPSKR